MPLWWPKQNHQIVTNTPRKQKPLIAPSPTPQYQHNYGAGQSVNYVPPEWHSYQIKHILQIVPLPRRQALLTCTCGHSAQAAEKHIHSAFHALWTKHEAFEWQLKTFYDTLHAALPEPVKVTKLDNPYFR